MGAIEGSCLGVVDSKVRIRGSCGEYEERVVLIPVEAIVFASDWPLSSNLSALTVYGCPVTKGSPFGVAMRSAAGLLVAGTILEVELPDPGKYKRGKETLSVLVVGLYSAKGRWNEEGAIYHVRDCISKRSNFDASPQVLVLAG